MNLERLVQATKQQMPAKRWEHTLGVAETAVKLARQFGADTVKAETAALLHDYCKYWPAEKLAQIVNEQELPADLLEYDPQLLHAPVAAIVVKRDLGIDDDEILDAVRYHTSGREKMTKLDKVVCLADYIEPGRDFPGVERIRELAETSMEKALIAGFDSTIQFLLAKGKKIYPLTVMARNGLIDEIKRIEHFQGG